MKELSVKELLEAGCHFGHQTSRWNPKMKPFIFGARNGIHILNLDKTVECAKDAYKFVADRVALGDSVIFVGTKKQASDIITEHAGRVNMFYMNNRWLGGMLTNFRTVKQGIERLQTLYQRRDAGDFAKLPKKEAIGYEREIAKFEKTMSGIKNMTKLPGAVFIVDPKTEHIALAEAKKLGLPIIAITDTNCDPEGIDFAIPANDDAIRSISLITSYIADACAEGMERRSATLREEAAKVKEEKPSVAVSAEPTARVKEKKVSGKARAYTAEPRPFGDKKGGAGKKAAPIKETKETKEAKL